MKKYLVINADDYGLTRGVVDGIAESLEGGHLSDVSMMANAEAFEYGVERLQSLGVSSCGAHLTIVDKEVPLSPECDLLRDGQHFLSDRNRVLARYC